MRKRYTVLVGLMAMLALLIAVTPTSMAKTKLTMLGWYGSESLDALLAEFEEQNPDIDVEYLAADNGPQGMAEKLAVMSAGGTAPDVTMVQHAILGQLLTSDLWADLHPYISRDSDFELDAYFPQMIRFFNRNATVGGEGQVALPTCSYAHVLFYNKDLFQQAGLRSPVEYHEQGIWNWSAFENVCRKLTRDTSGDSEPDQYGFVMNPDWIHGYIVLDNGGRFYTPDGKRTLVTLPEVVEATQWMADLMNVHKIAKWDQWNHPTFLAGNAGMFLCAKWMASQVNNTSIDYDVAPMFTRDPDRLHQTPAGDGIAIAAGSKNKDAAWKLVKFLLSRRSQLLWAADLGVPVMAEVARSDEFLHPDVPPYNMEAFVYEVAHKTTVITPRVVPSDASSKIWNASMAVFRGEKAAQTAFSEIEDSVNQILREAFDQVVY